MMIDLDQLSTGEISLRLKKQPDPTYDIPPELLQANAREAAVLVPFYASIRPGIFYIYGEPILRVTAIAGR